MSNLVILLALITLVALRQVVSRTAVCMSIVPADMSNLVILLALITLVALRQVVSGTAV